MIHNVSHNIYMLGPRSCLLSADIVVFLAYVGNRVAQTDIFTLGLPSQDRNGGLVDT